MTTRTKTYAAALTAAALFAATVLAGLTHAPSAAGLTETPHAVESPVPTLTTAPELEVALIPELTLAHESGEGRAYAERYLTSILRDVQIIWEFDYAGEPWCVETDPYMTCGMVNFGEEADVVRLAPHTLDAVWLEAGSLLMHEAAHVYHKRHGLGFRDVVGLDEQIALAESVADCVVERHGLPKGTMYEYGGSPCDVGRTSLIVDLLGFPAGSQGAIVRWK